MNRLFVLVLAALVVAGCKSNPLSKDASPRVMGRVLAEDTGRPVADVKVIRWEQTEDLYRTVPRRGGERLTAPVTVQTDAEGRFLFETGRVLTPFRASGWFSVQLSFEHPGYERYLTNYSYLNLGTNTWKGEPVLDAGKILLQPASK
jgi:hypothetical protein